MINPTLGMRLPYTSLMLFALAFISASRISDQLATAAGREVLAPRSVQILAGVGFVGWSLLLFFFRPYFSWWMPVTVVAMALFIRALRNGIINWLRLEKD
jgi:hypothetical protein